MGLIKTMQQKNQTTYFWSSSNMRDTKDIFICHNRLLFYRPLYMSETSMKTLRKYKLLNQDFFLLHFINTPIRSLAKGLRFNLHIQLQLK